MTSNDSKKKIQLLNSIMVYASIFAAIISILLIFNYIQTKTINPIETPAIQQLVDRLKENPQDAELRQQIRSLDLLARKAYFTSQWQIRTGGYLVFISVVIALIAMQLKLNMLAKFPEVGTEPTADWQARLLARKWVTVGGLSLFGLALIAAFLSHSNLDDTFENQAVVNVADSSQTENTTPKAQLADTNVIANDTSSLAVAATDSSMSEFPSTQELRANFPSFRGAGGNGVAFQKNIPTSWDGKSGKNIKWKTALPKKGFNSPIVWGNKIFLAGADPKGQEVYCIDLSTGKMLWQQKADKIQGSPATPPKTTDDTGLSASTTTTDGRRVYAMFGTGDIICFDMDGNRLWARNIGVPDNHYGHSSSLITYRNVLLIQFDHNKGSQILGLDVKSGKTLWTTQRGAKISWASPVLVNTGKQMEVILNAEPFVASYNPLTGKELWKIDAVFGEVGPSVAFADGFVYAVNEYARLVGIKLGEKPEIAWEASDYLPEVASPVATAEFVFIATSYGTAACHNAKTGELIWEHEFGNGFYASPMLVGGKIYLMDKGGAMHIFSAAKEFKLIGEPKLGEASVCTPAFADGIILIRGDKNLYCIGK